MIEALILDAGGVVLHEDPADYDAFSVPLGFAPGQVWAAVHDIPEYRPSRVGAITREQFGAAIRARLMRDAASDRVDQVLALLQAYYRERNVLRPVMRDLLLTLKGRVKTALLSNAAPGATQRFIEQGIGELVDQILCSGETGVVKPEAAAYELAATRLGVAVTRCAFVDDVGRHVDAAIALGLQGHVYHHTRHADFERALAGWGIVP